LFTRNRARQLIDQYLAKVDCGAGCTPLTNANGNGQRSADPIESAASEFFARALAEQLAQSDVFRITITSFLDAYNFDVRRLMKCCIHHVLPSGHVIPFRAYNVLYREGHVVLPALRDAGAVHEAESGRPGALVELTASGAGWK
jgi:tetraether lipid synthase